MDVLSGMVHVIAIAVFLHLIRGRFDNELEWPFQGTVTIQLLNKRISEERDNIEKVYNFNDTTPY